MVHYCTQCGMSGHNKRNAICRVNINRQRFQLTLEDINFTENIDIKLEILNDAIAGLEYEINHALHKCNDAKIAATAYDQMYKEAVIAHRYAQRTGPIERCVETYQALECAEASLQLMRQQFTAASKIKTNLIESWTKFREMEEQLLRPLCKHTSDYLKEVSLVLDLSAGDDHAECECPLCYDEIPTKMAVQTNCNHSYCITCVKNMATSIKDKTIKPSCPLCRTTITEMKTSTVAVLNEYKIHLESF